MMGTKWRWSPSFYIFASTGSVEHAIRFPWMRDTDQLLFRFSRMEQPLDDRWCSVGDDHPCADTTCYVDVVAPLQLYVNSATKGTRATNGQLKVVFCLSRFHSWRPETFRTCAKRSTYTITMALRFDAYYANITSKLLTSCSLNPLYFRSFMNDIWGHRLPSCRVEHFGPSGIPPCPPSFFRSMAWTWQICDPSVTVVLLSRNGKVFSYDSFFSALQWTFFTLESLPLAG